MFQHLVPLPDKKLDCEPAHVDHLYDGEDPVVAEDGVGALEEHGEGVEGEDDGGEDDAEHGGHGDDPDQRYIQALLSLVGSSC